MGERTLTKRSGHPGRSRVLPIAAGLYVALAVMSGATSPPEGGYGPASSWEPPAVAGSDGCLDCHDGIEEMHPGVELSCVDCHGGNWGGHTKLEAHVAPQVPPPGDERTLPLAENLAYLRFVNPMDLRVAARTCGECHGDLCADLQVSLHGTTAGHLSDGFYEMGLHDEPGSRYSVFPVPSHKADEGEVEQLWQTPAYRPRKGDPEDLGTYFPDLVRKECMQCHLYSNGRAVRGRVGFDGDYRGSGCAACHVPYALDGLSDGADRSVNRNEPGHPRRHVMTGAPSTQACTACHYGDASIGLNFRGFSQLPPGAPGGPDIEGTTDTIQNRTFYLDDPEICPPDVHHERGMHCIDCHTLADVMGDGRLHGQMEHAVEISCESCHGTFTRRSKRETERGTPLEHLFEEDGRVYLRSKVSGLVHPVKQVVDVLDRAHEHYNPRAREAMTGSHAGLECYTCHAAWNVNFLGFHFYRNEALTQLDILAGLRTPGRVTTQEKVFSTWKSFYAGLNENGRVAPYLTGFSTMGTVDAADGRRVLDQTMPVTQAGLSGVTMVHHQLHSMRPTARSCVECHRSSATWGMGSANFRLARQLAFVADRRGIEVVALERGQLAASTPLAKVILPDVVDIEVLCDPLQGHARYLFASEGGRGIHVVDVRDPSKPQRVAFVESVQPRGLALEGDYLFSADGIGGLKVYDVSKPQDIARVGVVPMFDAHEVEVRWPYAYVADGPGGLVIVDVRAPIAPRVVGGIGLVAGRNEIDATADLDVLFQYSRPEVGFDGDPAPFRTDARNLCAVVDQKAGLFLVDVTEPTHPRVLYPARQGQRTAARRRGNWEYRGLCLRSHVDLASPQGGERTFERDYVYLLEERLLANGDSRSALRVIDVTEPSRPRDRGSVQTGDQTEMLAHGSFYNAPFLQPVALVPGNEGVYVSDLSTSDEISQLGVLRALRSTYVVALEEFPLDKMIDGDGKRLKDVSRRPSRWLYRAEIQNVLDVDGRALGTIGADEDPPPVPGGTARSYFRRLDEDMSGLLTGDEIAAAGAAADRDGDGRVTLAELAEMGASFASGETSVSEAIVPTFLSTRVDPNGDLARLFDGVDPFAFDRDDDDRLDRKELSKALFAALDLNGDKRLTRAELSRHPGELRQLRYGDLRALEQFGRKDLNSGGTISSRELRVADRDWQALDANGDGHVQLEVEYDRYMAQRGFVPPPSEWPARRPTVIPLPPVIDVETVLTTFDRNGDGRLTKRELRNRTDLFYELDRDGDSIVEPREIARAVNQVLQAGVDVTPDEFVARWDLDGDGEVESGEVSEDIFGLLRRRERENERR